MALGHRRAISSSRLIKAPGLSTRESENLKCLLRQAPAHAAALEVRRGEVKDRIAEANLAAGSGDSFTANGGSVDELSQSVKIQTRDRDSRLNDAAPACSVASDDPTERCGSDSPLRHVMEKENHVNAKQRVSVLKTSAAFAAVVLMGPLGSISRAQADDGHNLKTPLKLVGGILVPGKSLSFDISWVDQKTERYFLAEAGNASVDVFDAENNLFLGRIGGFHGPAVKNDPCGRDGIGPSGVLMIPNKQLWVTDARGTVEIFDFTNAQPPFNLAPIATISTGAQCRADELAFDPEDHLIIVGNPAETTPVATLISSDPPYAVVGQIPFPGAGGLEQSLWDSQLHGGRFLVNVPGAGNSGMVAVIDPVAIAVETSYPTPGCAGHGLALGPFQNLLVGCGGGQPLLILNALDGHILNTITQIHGADEVWYNSGDDLFYAASNSAPNPVLGVIDAETNTFRQAVASGPGAHSVAAFAETNHVFVPIGIPTPTMPTDTCAAMFGFPAKTGCVAVYVHEDSGEHD